MKKLEKTKANPLDQIAKRIEKYTETYDSPLMHDPLTNSFKTEDQIKHEAGIKENNRVIDTLNKYEDMPDIAKQVIKYSPKKVPIKKAPVKKAPVRSKYIDDWEMFKQTATPAERKEFDRIEQKDLPMKKRKAYITTQSVYNSQINAALSAITDPIENNKEVELKPPSPKEVDPDLYQGLGSLFVKKGKRNIF
jgi:hypothetical protein